MAQRAQERPEEALLDIAAAADFLGVSRRTLYRLIEGADLPYVKISDRRRVFRKSDLVTFLDARVQRARKTA